ncbi:MAG: hypothetical protein ABIL68_10285 [bacterium]
MKTKSIVIVWSVALLTLLPVFVTLNAQTASRDTTRQKKTASPDSLKGELVLEVIEIQGKVEKPGVFIMPKRVEPELGEVELERSFKREVKEGIGEVLKPEKELSKVEDVKSIKKTVERKRK